MATQSLPLNSDAPLSTHTRVVLRQQAIAKGFVWAAAGLTMGVLVLIVGYIIVNGLYTRQVRDYPVMPYVEETVQIDDAGTELSVTVPRAMRIRDFTYQDLRDIFDGRTPYLGYLTTQNIDAVPVVYSGDGFAAAAERYLLPEGRTFDFYGDDVTFAGTVDSIQQLIDENPGAVVVAPPAIAERLTGTKNVGIRQIVVAVHPDILALQAGRRLQHLRRAQVADLYTGETVAWSAVGGPSIEVEAQDLAQEIEGTYDPLVATPIILDPAAGPAAPSLKAIGKDLNLRTNAVTVDTVDGFLATVTTTRGAIGIIRAREAMEVELPYLEIERISHWANLRPALFFRAPSRAGAVGGLSYIIVNTLAMIVFVLLIATPIGVSAAIYLVEYAKQGKLIYILRLGTDTLAGIPSIIFGLFGMVFFSQILGFKTGLVSGTLTLTIMILPTIVRTSEEALRSVSGGLREGSLALGATKLQTIFRVVLPAASPGILTGVILAIGRAVGETAALLFTMGSNLALVRSLNSPIRVLSVHLYMLIRENISIPNAFAAATILVVIVFIVNYSTTKLIGRLNKAAGQ